MPKVSRDLQAGADAKRKNEDNATALIWAGFAGHDECIELLLNAGADANVLTSLPNMLQWVHIIVHVWSGF